MNGGTNGGEGGKRGRFTRLKYRIMSSSVLCYAVLVCTELPSIGATE